MTNSSRIFLAVVGAGLFAVGLLVGFSTFYSNGYECGSAFRVDGDLFGNELADIMRGQDATNQCGEMRSDRSLYAWGLLIVGGAVVGGIGLIQYREWVDRRTAEYHAAQSRDGSSVNVAPDGHS